MSPNAKILTGRIVLSIIAIGTIVSPFLADWNVTHIYNPEWPPHAKFHNAQTMSMAVLLGVSALAFLWRPVDAARLGLTAAWVLTALYWVSQCFAFLFPGVAWTDPHLLQPGQWLRDFPLQLKGDLIVVFPLLLAAGWLLRSGTKDTEKSRPKSPRSHFQ